MPVDKSKSSLKSGFDVTKCVVRDVYLTPSKDAVEDRSGYKFEYPFTLKIEDVNGNVVSEEKSSPVMNAKNWNKKFYLTKPDMEGRQYINFTRYHAILALNMLMLKEGRDQVEDVNDFIGYEFDAVLMGKDNPFINWTLTFESYGIDVPSIESLGGVNTDSTVQGSVPVEKPKKSNVIDPNDLPF